VVDLADDAGAIVREAAAQAASSSQDAEETVDSALLEARISAEEMQLTAQSYQRKSWIAVLLPAVLPGAVTLWLTGYLSPERVLSGFR
jgi:hypothetical protein